MKVQIEMTCATCGRTWTGKAKLRLVGSNRFAAIDLESIEFEPEQYGHAVKYPVYARAAPYDVLCPDGHCGSSTMETEQ